MDYTLDEQRLIALGSELTDAIFGYARSVAHENRIPLFMVENALEIAKSSIHQDAVDETASVKESYAKALQKLHDNDTDKTEDTHDDDKASDARAAK